MKNKLVHSLMNALEYKSWIRNEIHPSDGNIIITKYTDSTVNQIETYLINHFDACERYLNVRHHKTNDFKISNEYALQDLLYFLLEPHIGDLEWENPSQKLAGKSWHPDFDSKTMSLGIEAKYIRSGTGKRVVEEMKSDINDACSHPYCRSLIFVVYDRVAQAGTKTQLKQLEGEHTHISKKVNISVIIIP